MRTFSLLILIWLLGCTANYGRLQHSHQITRAFENELPLPRHEYYYLGVDYMPLAIVGIDASYELEANSWRRIDYNIIRLDQLTDRMLNREGYAPAGFRIIGPDGKQIGVWYSSLHWAVVKIEEGNRITVLSPELPAERGRR
ncbi:MAG: hypothetical protein PVI71_15405 [Desulfobacterales bacterium]